MSIKLHQFTPAMLSSFTKIAISVEDEQLGLALSTNTLAVLQNLRAQIAEEKLHLVLDPSKLHEYAQQEAHLRGQLDILSYLINAADEVQKKIVIDDKPQQ